LFPAVTSELNSREPVREVATSPSKEPSSAGGSIKEVVVVVVIEVVVTAVVVVVAVVFGEGVELGFLNPTGVKTLP